MKRYETLRGEGWTFEEIGRNEDKFLEVAFDVDIWPGEERTRDYPGSGPEFDIYNVRALTKFGNGWQEYADKIAKRLVEDNEDQIIEFLKEEDL